MKQILESEEKEDEMKPLEIMTPTLRGYVDDLKKMQSGGEVNKTEK